MYLSYYRTMNSDLVSENMFASIFGFLCFTSSEHSFVKLEMRNETEDVSGRNKK